MVSPCLTIKAKAGGKQSSTFENLKVNILERECGFALSILLHRINKRMFNKHLLVTPTTFMQTDTKAALLLADRVKSNMNIKHSNSKNDSIRLL